MRRILTSILVLSALGLGLVVASPTMATKAEAHGGITNGCSGPAPEMGAGWNFHDECDQHDRCYHYHWYGEGENGRYWCDQMFLSDMQREANRYPVWHPNHWGSMTTAGIFYRFVRWYGTPYFNKRSPDAYLPYVA